MGGPLGPPRRYCRDRGGAAVPGQRLHLPAGGPRRNRGLSGRAALDRRAPWLLLRLRDAAGDRHDARGRRLLLPVPRHPGPRRKDAALVRLSGLWRAGHLRDLADPVRHRAARSRRPVCRPGHDSRRGGRRQGGGHGRLQPRDRGPAERRRRVARVPLRDGPAARAAGRPAHAVHEHSRGHRRGTDRVRDARHRSGHPGLLARRHRAAPARQLARWARTRVESGEAEPWPTAAQRRGLAPMPGEEPQLDPDAPAPEPEPVPERPPSRKRRKKRG